MSSRIRHIALVLVALVCVPRGVVAQPAAPDGAASPTSYIEVLRTRNEVEQAAAELARADALLKRAMLSPSEHEERRAAYVRARLAHFGALLAASGARQRLAVVRAVKSRAPDGRLRVSLTLRNEAAALGSALGASLGESRPTSESSPALPDADLADWTTVRGATIALKVEAGANGATISRPYERTVRELAPSRECDVEFDLLEDVADVVVMTDVAGRTEERRIRLEVASATNVIAIDAAQFSLEGDLGSQITYDLRLQRPRPSGGAMRLVVRGLPAEAAYEFRDPDGRTRIGQLRFADGATAARVQLAISLPARPSAAVRTDTPLAFDVAAADTATGAAGAAHLELVPRGVARLELRPATLALQALADGATTLVLTVRNAGSGRVDDVRLRAETPARWQATLEPAVISTLAAGDERRVSVRMRPPADAAGGDYELRLGVDDANAGRRIEAEDKLVRVRVAGSGGSGALMLGALAAVALTVLVVHGRRWVHR